jgi:hypothetical protein
MGQTKAAKAKRKRSWPNVYTRVHGGGQASYVVEMCSVITVPDELFLESRPVHQPFAPGEVLLVVDKKKRSGVLA